MHVKKWGGANSTHYMPPTQKSGGNCPLSPFPVPGLRSMLAVMSELQKQQ